MTCSKERIKFSNQQVYWYFYIVGWGKTGWTHSSFPPPLPPPKCSDLSIYLSVFWIILLFHCILTLMNDLFQRESQVFKHTSLLVLLHCGVGKDWAHWAGPFFTPPPPILNVSIFLFIFQCFGLYFSFTVS